MLTDVLELRAERRYGLVVRVEQPPLGQQAVHEGIAKGPFGDAAEHATRHHRRVYVDAVVVERPRAFIPRSPSLIAMSTRSRCRTCPRPCRARGCRRAPRPAPCGPVFDLLDQLVEGAL